MHMRLETTIDCTFCAKAERVRHVIGLARASQQDLTKLGQAPSNEQLSSVKRFESSSNV
ncbi:MAG: hypothetical protein OJF49_003377 [Ktedonobacterales bacterium]|nr:MAG: hypothetical protein OJF49_003377 [Ktedonobacterales bacterium]